MGTTATFFSYLISITLLAHAAPPLLIAYLLGSIPFGYLIVRLKSGSDIRETGSGGTGATNVLRKAGRAAGVVTLALDAAKGFLAVSIARWLASGESDQMIIIALAAVFAVIGHCFPVWLKFHAGKGVATGLGVCLAIAPWSVLAALLVFGLIQTVASGNVPTSFWVFLPFTALLCLTPFQLVLQAVRNYRVRSH